jgi:hypothetical protein
LMTLFSQLLLCSAQRMVGFIMKHILLDHIINWLTFGLDMVIVQ